MVPWCAVLLLASQPAASPDLPAYLQRWRDQMPVELSYRVRAQDGMPQVLLPAGEVLLGSPATEVGRGEDEGPQRQIRLSACWLDLHEVTVAQYRRFCEATQRPSPRQEAWSQDDHPVVNVTWANAHAYAIWVGGSLPTEAQWERAARGGQEGWRFVWGDRPEDGRTRANLGLGDPFQQTSPVGSFAPNPYGLFDLAGNVWEWCEDWYDATWYERRPREDPVNTTPGRGRVTRGACWFSDEPASFRVANRAHNQPTDRYDDLGFRCVGGGVATASHQVPGRAWRRGCGARWRPPAPDDRGWAPRRSPRTPQAGAPVGIAAPRGSCWPVSWPSGAAAADRLAAARQTGHNTAHEVRHDRLAAGFAPPAGPGRAAAAGRRRPG